MQQLLADADATRRGALMQRFAAISGGSRLAQLPPAAVWAIVVAAKAYGARGFNMLRDAGVTSDTPDGRAVWRSFLAATFPAVEAKLARVHAAYVDRVDWRLITHALLETIFSLCFSVHIMFWPADVDTGTDEMVFSRVNNIIPESVRQTWTGDSLRSIARARAEIYSGDFEFHEVDDNNDDVTEITLRLYADFGDLPTWQPQHSRSLLHFQLLDRPTAPHSYGIYSTVAANLRYDLQRVTARDAPGYTSPFGIRVTSDVRIDQLVELNFLLWFLESPRYQAYLQQLQE